MNPTATTIAPVTIPARPTADEALPTGAPLPTALHKLFALRGQFASLRTVRPLKVRKGKAEILKDSTFVCRVGVDYSNIKAVQEKQANGDLPSETQPLPWGNWLMFPYVIQHKGVHYFRCATVHNADSIPRVTYTRNGLEISKDEAQVDALASEFQDKSDNDVFTVKVESILEINGVPI